MKIIFLNNYYYMRGGSERVFFGEMDMMKRHGHPVAGFARRHSLDMPSEYERFFPPDITTNKISLSWEAVKTIKEIFYSIRAKDRLKKLVDEFKPDIAHVHNMYGRLTTSILDLLSEKKIPAVMTLHDYKLVCPSYKFMFNGHICEDCKRARYYKAVKNRCHKESYWASAVIAMESYVNERLNKYRKSIKYLISPSHFLKHKLIDFGWSENQIEFVPNFLNLSDFNPNYTPGKYFLYLGRLSEEKGIRTLIKAFSKLQNRNAELLVVGDGPIRKELENQAENNQRVRFAGYLSGNSLLDATRNALAVVVPSEWYENAPISILEALACGKPVIGATIGGIPEMIEDGVNGFLFKSGNSNALAIALARLAEMDATEIENMGRAARKKAEREYGTESHYQSLMEIYRKALKE
ncbi:MAG: glycosyltransferase family 4 protein [Syntrophaceae bacterium]|nr:glycosyltransferase family 4 protein [Syntrophaceae bacterium]